ncbi:MAG: DUF1800 domain-containing protein [Pseudomonadota bacterium]
MRVYLLAFLGMLALPAHAAAPSAEQQALHVLNRIAYGPTPGDVARVQQMGVKRYIDAQLEPAALAYPAPLVDRLAALELANLSAGDALAQFNELRRDVREEEPGAKQRRAAGYRAMVLEADEARLLRAVHSPRQLEEVMVDFWYNHFNVFSGKGSARAMVASYERDAIRPYVFGKFRTLLGASAKHPAMLVYLDNQLSRSGALNENYARELMELHTLGVDGGYKQKDVTELARMLTGWSFAPRALMRKDEGFRFDAQRHDQGTKTWLGSAVAQRGQGEGEFALDVLARHPSTARHISYKLAQYFVQDEPPTALVARMAGTWQASDGDIRAVLRTLLASDEFLAPASIGAKFKTPYQYVVSAARASGAPLGNVGQLVQSLTQLGMPLYGCTTPDGYKNTEAAWLNPGALTRRIVFATAAGARLDAAQLDVALGAAISPRTRAQVAANPEPLRAAMLLGSPDFMQR